MKKMLLVGFLSCLCVGQVSAKELDQDVAVGMASLMICATFYAENDMRMEGTIVGQSMMTHINAGIEEETMSPETSKALDLYMNRFQSANKEQQIQICKEAIEYARNSQYGKVG